MPIEITMPALSPTMESGTLTSWKVKKGDKITSGMVLAEIETDKASMELEAVDTGIVGEVLVPEGSHVKVQTVIALLLDKGEDESALKGYKIKGLMHGSAASNTAVAGGNATTVPAQGSGDTKVTAIASAAVTTPIPMQPFAANNGAPENNASGRIIASPLAKRIAVQENINLASISGSGPRGRIIKNDLIGGGQVSVASASNKMMPRVAQSAANGENTVTPLSNMRKVIASRLTESKTTIPHFYLSVDCDITSLMEMRVRLNSANLNNANGNPAKISVNDILIKAVACAMKQMPEINVSWNGDSIIHYGSVDISVAVSIPDGLITPIIFNADQLGLIEISSTMKELASRARAGKLAPAEYQGGSFSISNLGMYGVKQFNAILNPPQACILAIGAGEKRPLVDANNELVIREIMNITMSVDHRVIDGSLAAEFIKLLKTIVETPMMLSI